jgi:iron(II)-dependent oxidoreductase
MKCLLCGQENNGTRTCSACGTALVPEDRLFGRDSASTLIKDGDKEHEGRLIAKDGSKMIFIPSGDFIMGSNDGYENERPSHTTSLGPYYIDMCPVTNRQYEKFVNAAGYQSQGEWRSFFTPGREDHPVVKVSWYDALAYCEWAGKSLPTEEQWEKAARGTDGRCWPWGNKWEPSFCNCYGHGPGTTTRVGSYGEGRSPFGCLDMAGNVWEWTLSLYGAYPGSDFYSICFGARFRIMKGGAYKTRDEKSMRCSVRMPADPVTTSDMRGFRGMLFPA